MNRAGPSLTRRPLSVAPANISSNARRAAQPSARVVQDQRERESDAVRAVSGRLLLELNNEKNKKGVEMDPLFALESITGFFFFRQQITLPHCVIRG